MRIIIAGAGNVGTYLVKMFTNSNHDVIIIDNNKEKLEEISAHYDVMPIFGSASSLLILKDAEVRKSKLFIAVSNSQEINILSAIIAKKLGSKRTIARIDNPEYLHENTKLMLENLGVDSLVYPEILASEEIICQLKQPNLLKSMNFTSDELQLFTMKIDNNSRLLNKQLHEINEMFPGIVARVVAIKRETETIIPNGQETVLNGDLLYITTENKGKHEIIKLLGLSNFEIKNVMILGGSRIGVKIAEKLEKYYYVKLFEKSLDKSYSIADLLKDTLVIHSEARSADFLLDEGISRTDVFIAVTGNSEINMLSCMLAKKLGVKKTYAEIENMDYFELAQNTDIDYIINKKLIAASNIFAYTIDAEVLSVKYFTNTDAQLLEFVVHKKSKITKKALKDIDFTEHALIGGVVRNNKPFIAVGDTHLLPDDKVVVFCLPGYSDKIAKWFK